MNGVTAGPVQDFYFRQIIGSANYRCGSDLNDFLHGWLNYQLEHHLWPDMRMVDILVGRASMRRLTSP